MGFCLRVAKYVVMHQELSFLEIDFFIRSEL
jgi:hypothetical protein